VQRWSIWAVAMLAGAGALASGSLSDSPASMCGQRLCRRDHLPAPITLATAHARFLIAPDGRVRRAGAPRSAGPPGAAVFPATGSWYVFARGHLIIGRDHRTLWRAPGAGWSATHIGVVVVRGRMFAFQYAHRLYMGPFDGKARAVARNEMPLGWSKRRLYTNSYPRRALLLRAPTGHLLKVLSPLPFHTDPVVADGSVYLTLGGSLMRARAARAQRLASLSSLGMSADSWLQRVGTLLELQDNRRMTLLRPDGSVFASTPWPRRHGDAGTLSGSPVADASGHALAFTVAYGESPDQNAAAWAPGEETVYLLREGARTAAPLHTEDVSFRACERSAGVQWHGSWLLYGNSEGNVVLIDAVGTHRAIDLTAVAAQLTGARTDLGAYWTGHPS
jgi:hypothetical protein